MTAAVDSCETVFHVAAHRAVERSVADPLATDLANVHGTLTVLQAAHEAGARRDLAASSSSVYGGAREVPHTRDGALGPAFAAPDAPTTPPPVRATTF